MSGLAKVGVRAVKWSVVTTIIRFALQLAAQVVLARMLGPENYGIFGIGMVVLTLSNFLSNFGFGWNLLHKSDLTDEDVRFAFTWQVIAGATAMISVYLLSPWLAAYFHEPRVESVIRWLSLACLMGAAAAPASSLLQREFNFKAIGLIQVVSYAIGYIVVGIPMAMLDYGVSALVAAWLVQALVAMLAGYAIRPHALRPLFRFSGMAAAMGTSGIVFATNVVNWWLNNLDRVLIGRLLNVHAVGVYTAGYNLATLPNSLLLGALQPAFMAAGARMQSDTERLSRAYLQMLASICVLVLPFFVFLAVISLDLVRLLYGPQWSDTGGVLAILFLGMPAYVAWGISTPILWNTGRKHHEALLQLPVLCLGFLGFYFSIQMGVQMAAATASVLAVFRMLVIGVSAFQVLGLRYTVVLPELMRGVLLSSLCAASALAGRLAVADWKQPVLSLLASCLLAMATFCIMVLLRPNVIGAQATSILIMLAPRLTKILLPTQRSPTPLTQNIET